MFYSVDRINENLLTLIDDDGNQHIIQQSQVLGEFRETDLLVKTSNDTFTVDKNATLKRKKEMSNLLNSLYE